MAVALVKLNTSSQEKDQETPVCDAEGRAAGEHRLTNYKKAETSSTKKLEPPRPLASFVEAVVPTP